MTVIKLPQATFHYVIVALMHRQNIHFLLKCDKYRQSRDVMLQTVNAVWTLDLKSTETPSYSFRTSSFTYVEAQAPPPKYATGYHGTLHNYNEPFFQVGLLDRALISLGLALSPPSTSISSDFLVLCKCFYKKIYLLHFTL